MDLARPGHKLTGMTRVKGAQCKGKQASRLGMQCRRLSSGQGKQGSLGGRIMHVRNDCTLSVLQSRLHGAPDMQHSRNI